MPLGFYAERDLPHPPISLPVFLVVENGIRAAWELMRNKPRPGFDLLNEVEDVVTHELYERLYEEVFNKNVVEGFDRELLTVVTRESKLRNYDGAHLDKMPDLLFGLAGRPNVCYVSQDWLFVECKPVDSNHSVAVHYCGKGINRFLQGEYAWAMTSALMLGYARDGFTIEPMLTDVLWARGSRMSRIWAIDLAGSPGRCGWSRSGPSDEGVYSTRHERYFWYLETKQQAEPITIRHLWLRRD